MYHFVLLRSLLSDYHQIKKNSDNGAYVSDYMDASDASDDFLYDGYENDYGLYEFYSDMD